MHYKKIVRLGSHEDYKNIIPLWKASVTATHTFLRKEHLALLERDMATLYLPAVAELWLCEYGGSLAGFCGCNRESIEMLFVHPDFMRMGIGSGLLAHARSLHGPLKVDVNEENRQALAFYLSLGFQVIGRSERDSQSLPYPLLHLDEKCEA